MTRARHGAAFLGLALGLASTSCASASRPAYVWVDEYTPAPNTVQAEVIRPGDLVDVRVLGQDQLSAKTRVRSDGQVSLPFLGDLAAGGLAPGKLSAVLEQRLKTYVNSPVVAVSVEQAAAPPVSILGEVARSGKYPYEPGMRLLDVLALAGGLTEYAHKDRIFVMRGRPTPTRIRFDSRRLLGAEGRAASFVLEPGDVVVVE
jgi:polysaccharide export outer membrane protein